MKLVLVTGAGASRRLGRGDHEMPLMHNWSDALCAALDAHEGRLAAACHLKPGMSSEEFEENLGLLLRWRRVQHLEERFRGLASAKSPGSVVGPVKAAGDEMKRRLEEVERIINATLYAQFDQKNIDNEKASAAFAEVLGLFGSKPELVVATTNYDRAAEEALAALGHDVDTGFRPRTGPRTPRLQPVNLVSGRDGRTPLLFLHGAVGWYFKDGGIEDHRGDQEFNATLGTPVVLYPDPAKDPTNDQFVSELWHEFEIALADADAVLVIGHSLHDPALVRVLNAVAGSKRVGITYFEEKDLDHVKQSVGDCLPIQMDFGPGITCSSPRALDKLVKG